MANCSLLEADQKPTDKPSKRIKRSGGHSLVNRGLAVWIVENVLLRMVDEKRLKASTPMLNSTPNAQKQCRRAFIPETMPPNIDGRLGIVVRVPDMREQTRFRPVPSSGWRRIEGVDAV